MPEIRPFSAIRYNPAKVGDLNLVVTQPYDKIDPKLQEEYYHRSPYNFVRLILGKIEPTDDDKNNRYTRAKATFEKWLSEGVLIRDPEPALYPYHQEFTLKDKAYCRRGFIGILRVEEFGGKILPHERTLSKPKEDRYRLFRTTMKNFETVFMLYTDPEQRVIELLKPEGQPLIEVKDDFGFTHKLWKVADLRIIGEVQKVFQDSTLLIADGHHRYETSLRLKRELGGDGPHNYRLITFVNIEDSGLVILPTHRLIFNLVDFTLEGLIQKLLSDFSIKGIGRAEIESELKGSHRFVMVTRDTTHLLELKDEGVLARLLPDRAPEYRRLDVTILHTLIIERALGIDPSRIEDHVRYRRGIDDVFRAVDSGQFQIGFLLNPTTPVEVKSVAMKGERMPQKSTDFFPKMISGLVIYDLLP